MLTYHLGRGQFYMVLKGSVNFGPRGSTALGFGGHAHRAFPEGFGTVNYRSIFFEKSAFFV